MKSPRVRSAAIALCCTLLVLTGMSAACYCVGRGTPAEAAFLPSWRSPTFGETSLAVAAEYAAVSHDSNDAIFVGDSACRHGIDPIEFRRLTGLTAYNLGTFGTAGHMSLPVITGAYLSNHPRPKLVVLLVGIASPEYVSLKGEKRMQQQFVMSYRFYGDAIPGLDSSVFDSLRFFVRTGGKRIARLGKSGCKHLDEPLGEVPSETFFTMRQKIRDGSGYVPLMGHSSKPDPRYNGDPYRVNPDFDSAVRILAKMCADHGLRLMIRFGPTNRSFKNARDYEPLYSWLDTIERECPGVAACRPVLLWYDRPECWDFTHPNVEGTKRFMPTVAKDVQDMLAH